MLDGEDAGTGRLPEASSAGSRDGNQAMRGGSGIPRPRLLCSRCLGFDACRYDGAGIPDELVRRLIPFVDFVPVCPEVEIGLGIPRRPVRLVRTASGTGMIQPSSGRDLTGAMESFAASFLGRLGPVDGAILKSRSPSCGIADVSVYEGAAGGPLVAGMESGLFARALKAMAADHPFETEGRLRDLGTRERFLTRIFASADFRSVRSECSASASLSPLVEHHASLKLLLMAMDREAERSLGRLLGSPMPLDRILEEYGSGLAKAMSRPSGRGPAADSLLHALEFFGKELGSAEKTAFLDSVEGYRAGRLPLSACLTVLRAWLARWDIRWLSTQKFLSPYPAELVDAYGSGRDRDSD
jgi:uncharacterized protein YbgA (DUF1722 family)/uncharacterized protein YbbK (DUF523 family)